jgi:hypothetical protein
MKTSEFPVANSQPSLHLSPTFPWPSPTSPSRQQPEIAEMPRNIVPHEFLSEIRRPRVQKKMQRLIVSEEAIVQERVAELLAHMKLSLFLHASSLTGNRVFSNNSLKQYGSLFRSLRLSLKHIGDFCS